MVKATGSTTSLRFEDFHDSLKSTVELGTSCFESPNFGMRSIMQNETKQQETHQMESCKGLVVVNSLVTNTGLF